MAGEPRNRSQFQPSGQVDWVRFLLFLPIPGLLVVLLLAFIAASVEQWVWLPIIFAITMSIAAAVATACLVTGAHCRSLLIASLSGIAIGGGMYFEQFLMNEAYRKQDWTMAARIDQLPRVVSEIVTERKFPLGKRRRNMVKMPVLNWIIMPIELLVITSISAWAGYTSANSGYCERCRRWMTKKTVHASAGSGPQVRAALEADSPVDAIVELPEFGSAGDESSRSDYELEGCTHNGDFDKANFYLSITEHVTEGESDKEEKILTQTEITGEEFALLATKIKGFAEVEAS
jgi:hypothetical protein